MFSQVCGILFTGRLSGRHPSPGRRPSPRQTPPWGDTPQQTPSPWQTPSLVDTPRQTSPPRRLLQRTVRILLECILVSHVATHGRKSSCALLMACLPIIITPSCMASSIRHPPFWHWNHKLASFHRNHYQTLQRNNFYSFFSHQQAIHSKQHVQKRMEGSNCNWSS